MGYIYKITNTISGNVYIGKTEKTIASRWREHCRSSFKISDKDYHLPLHNAIRKYGKEAFIVEEIDNAINSEELKQKEIYWIKYYNSYYKGYNATLGGDGQRKYDYQAIANYYKQCGSVTLTCQHFGIYDQVFYSALQNYPVDNVEKPKIKKKVNRRVKCIELNKIFSSLKEIEIYFNSKSASGNVLRTLRGITKKAYGYHWQEVSEEEYMNWKE